MKTIAVILSLSVDRLRRASFALPALALALLLPGCASLPDVHPFTDATGSLRSAIASGGSATVAELARVGIPGASTEATNLANAWIERDRVFTALTTYANSLQAIVDSGQSGAASAQALADAVTKLATTANIIQPGSGAAVGVVSETAVFVYDWIAKARAAASLEKALAAVQPAVERVAQVIGADMKKLDELIRLAAKAQTDGLDLNDKESLGYRLRLIGSREEFMKRMNKSLADGKAPTALTEATELKRVDELLDAANSWYEPLQSQQKEIATREKVARQLIAETQVALQDWATAHAQLLAAVRTKRAPSIAELSAAAERIRELVQKFRNL